MRDPALVIMAAGMGSRFGGLKQMAPIGKEGEPILMFSLYDALQEGFRKFVFIIKEEMEKDFQELVLSRLPSGLALHCVFQRLEDLPGGRIPPEGRTKPWGTGHAVLCAAPVLNEPFAVVNADDFYGRDAFRVMYERLARQEDDELYRFSMVGYQVRNTVTAHGHVTRGVCTVENGYLTGIQERFRVSLLEGAVCFSEDEGKSWTALEDHTPVSMNFWGFSRGFLVEAEKRFPLFLDRALVENPLKGEFLLPAIVNELIEEGKATVEVLSSSARWYGVTYKEDLPAVAEAIQQLQTEGTYPERLFEKQVK
ncbi:MAG: sugar phosphate nucleotidyltransferase [Bacillota bacterium]|nr:sugar phosphate nucleotidyltransferase [Bacillota bacterium]